MTSSSISPVGRPVIIVGDSCSGKSTLGVELATRMACLFIELDAFYWKPGWKPSELQPFREKVDEETRAEAWVLAGNYDSVRDITWPRANTIIWLDIPLRVTLPRIVSRSYRRWRDDEILWGTNRERFFHQFKVWDPAASLIAWNIVNRLPRRRRYIEAERNPNNNHLRFHRISSSGALRGWLKSVSLPAAEAPDEP